MVGEFVLLARVREAAEQGGWLLFHDGDSRKSVGKGFPDVVLVRSGVLLFVELKSDRGRVSREQRRWVEALGEVPGVRAAVVRGEEETKRLCRWLTA